MPFDLLIELYPLVPFVLEVLIAQSVYIWTSSAWTPVTGAEAVARTNRTSEGSRHGSRSSRHASRRASQWSAVRRWFQSDGARSKSDRSGSNRMSQSSAPISEPDHAASGIMSLDVHPNVGVEFELVDPSDSEHEGGCNEYKLTGPFSLLAFLELYL